MANRLPSHKLLKIAFFSCLFVTSFYIGFQYSEENSIVGSESLSPMSANTARGTILISDNFSFTTENGVISGAGHETDPYVIANWNIMGPDDSPCIEIRNTTFFFIVRDCVLSNGPNAAGIRLSNLQNGVLLNNSISGAIVGIECDQVYNVDVWENSCFYAADAGIVVKFSEDVHILGNSAYENQRFGILLFHSNSCVLFNNYASQNDWDGIRIEYGFSSHLHNNTCINNLEFGIILYYSEDNVLSENTCSYNGKHGIAFVFDSRDNTAYGNTLLDNGYGCIGDEFALNYCSDNYCSEGTDILWALFSVSKTTVEVGETIQFTDLSTGSPSPLQYYWDFGDGAVSYYKNPSHSYDEIGDKLVTLTIQDESGATSSKTFTIHVVAGSSTSTNPFGDVFGEIGGYPISNFMILMLIPFVVLIFITKKKRK